MSAFANVRFHPVTERLEETLGLEVRRLVSLARTRALTPDELDKLAGSMHPNLSSSLIADLMEIYCKQLYPPDLYTFQSDQVRPETKRLVYTALCGFQLIVDLSPSQVPTLLPFVRRHWTALIMWIRFFSSSITSELGDGEQTIGGSFPRTIMVLISVIRALLVCDSESFTTSIGNQHCNSGFFDIVVKLWWLSDKFREIDSSFVHDAFIHLYLGVNHTPRLGRDPSDATKVRISTTVLEEIGGDVVGLAKRVIGHLSSPLLRVDKGIALTPCALLFSLCLVTDDFDIPSTEASTKFLIAFFKNDLVPRICRLLKYISTDSTPKHLNFAAQDIPDAIQQCFMILNRSLSIPGALHWASVILRRGLLESIANISDRSEDHKSKLELPKGVRIVNHWSDDIRHMFKELLPPLLVHRNFVNAAIRAIKGAAENGAFERIESGFLKDIWSMFVGLILERTAQIAIYKRSRVLEIVDVRRCTNCGRNRGELEKGLSKCKGCFINVYCSRDCQITAWKAGHRIECGFLKDTSYCETLRYGANSFLKVLAVMDVRRHALGIKNIINRDENLRKLRLQDIVFDLSYASYPPTIRLRPAEEFFRNMSEENLHDLTISRTAPSLKPDQILVNITSRVTNNDGPKCLSQYIESTALLDGPPKLKDTDMLSEFNDSTSSPRSRTPLIYFDGRVLAYEMDEIDACLSDAYHTYRKGSAMYHSGSKSKTVFEYLEKKIEAGELVPDINFTTWV